MVFLLFFLAAGPLHAGALCAHHLLGYRFSRQPALQLYPELTKEADSFQKWTREVETLCSRWDLSSQKRVGLWIDARRGQSHRFRGLARLYQGPEALRSLFELCAARLDVGSREERRHLERIGELPPSHQSVRTTLGGLKAIASGELGLFQTAIRLPGLYGVGLRMRDFPHAPSLLADGGIPEEAIIRYLDKEIDLVCEGGKCWVEVKKSGLVTLEVLHSTTHPFGRGLRKSILAQAQETAHLAQLLGVPLTLVFVGGITPEAAQVLRDLGIAVSDCR